MSHDQTRREYLYPFTADTYIFIGEKVTAVYLGEERVAVKNWREVFKLLMSCCNRECHDELMYLRNKAAGKVRVFLSDKPDGMVRPVKLDDDLFADSGQYGTATLLHILRDCILKPARFDYNNIRIAIQ